MVRTLSGWYRTLTLRARFAFHITLSTLVLFAALVPAVVYLERRAVLGGAWEHGLQLTKVFAHASVQGVMTDDFLAFRHVVNSVKSDPGVLYAMVLDLSGKILSHSDVRQDGKVSSDRLTTIALTAEKPIGQEISEPHLQAYEFAVPIFVATERRAVARVAVSLTRELARIRQTRNLVIGLGLLALGAGFGVAAWQARSVTRPLGDLVQGARNVAAGQLDNRIVTHGSDEVAQLGAAFNLMAEALQARIAEVKGAQDQLVRKTRLAAIGEIAAVMAHETRNPLGAISSSVQLLRRDASLSGENAELLDIIKAETDRLNGIVADFLAYGRPRAPVFQLVALHQIIDETLRVVSRDARWAASIVIERRLAATSPTVRADPHQLRQVLWNVFLNAAQAMGDGGRLTVATDRGLETMRIVVDDTGPGIPEADRARLFEPFQTRRPGGMGLGLATVRRIIEDHGGRVSLTSRHGGGTRVLIELPDVG